MSKKVASAALLTELSDPCPRCGGQLIRSIGEDEFSGDVLIPYDRIECNHCDFWCDTEDFDEERRIIIETRG